MKSKLVPQMRSEFSGFFIGPVIAAVLLAFGIDYFCAGLSGPVISWVIDGTNFLIRSGRLDFVGIQPFDSPWFIAATLWVPGTLMVVCGLGFATWLAKSQRAK